MTESRSGSGLHRPAGTADQDLERRQGRARGWLLRLAVVGGGLLGSFIGVVLGIVAGDQAGGVFTIPALLSLVAGVAAGYLLGRGIFALVAWRDPQAAASWGGFAWLLLVTPAYLVAGTIAAGIGVIGTGPVSIGLGDALRAILATLLLAWIVLAPLTLAFAPSMTGRPKVMHRSLLGCSGTFWVGLVTALWFGGSFMAVLLVLAAAQTAFPDAYDAAANESLLSVLMVVAWLALWAGGSAAAYRVVKRILASRG